MRCRLLRIEALCALGRARDAYTFTASLMRGEQLPQPHCSTAMWFQDEAGVPLPPPKPLPDFCEAALPGDAVNKDAVGLLTNGGMHAEIEAFYGPWACAQIALARARVLLLLGGVPCLWTAPKPSPQLAMHNSSETAPGLSEKVSDLLLLRNPQHRFQEAWLYIDFVILKVWHTTFDGVHR